MTGTWLVILLVVVWLFVLVPMVANTREPVRRTTAALADTRLLHRGDEPALRPGRWARAWRRRRDETAAGTADSEAPVDDEAVDEAGAEGVTAEEAADAPPGVDARAPVDPEDAPDVVAEAAAARADRSGEVRRVLDDVADDAVDAVDAEVDADTERANSEVETDRIPVGIVDAEYEEVAEYAAYEHAGSEANDGYAAADLYSDERSYVTADADYARTEAQVAGVYDEGGDEPADVDGAGAATERTIGRTRRRLVRADGHEDDSDVETRYVDPDELDDADLAYAARRRGRGGFDPVLDSEMAEERARRRQNTLLVLVGIVLGTGALALVVGGVWAWTAMGVAVLAVVLFLVALRRATKQELELRRRRIARMRRARLGVESREDAELAVVPERLRRPGAVVLETDDEDPAFDHLPLVERIGVRDPGLRRASGQ